MTPTTSWQRLLGVRPDEARTVWLFFLHNFLLGIGTILVYVAANVILLENNPERNLPLAYGAAALGMLAAGRLYTYFEHHWALQKLAVRVLLAVVTLSAVLGVLVWVGHSVAAAVAIMTGYRIIYLLTNLEFWGVSAVVFDVRQGRRLFSVISSGDMPAKALGAVLALLIHANADLPWLLLLAFGTYVGALFTLRATLGSHVVEARPAARPLERQQAVTGRLREWFGDSRLVLTLCLSLLGIAAVTTGVEYEFFVNVKHRFHDQGAVMRFVSIILTITYLAATLFKLLVSRVALDKVGVRGMLLTLPTAVLAGLLLVSGQGATGTESTSLLLSFCGLYLGLEVLRRAVFDPVFLVLFQPLSPPERLAAHTRVKGVFEPLGMGVAGLLLYVQNQLPRLSEWAPFAWMVVLMAGSLYFLYRTYGHYVGELQHALGRRFAADELVAEVEGEASQTATPGASGVAGTATAAEIQTRIAALSGKSDKTGRAAAASYLVRLGPAAVPALAAELQRPPEQGVDEALVRRVAQVLSRIPTPASRAALVALARPPHLFRREVALRALRNFAPVLAEAPVFEALVTEEMRRAQRLLHGLHDLGETNEALARSLRYELDRVEQRVFGLLLQLYPPSLIADAQRGVAHAARERQANALEILDNIVPRAIYQGLQALFDLMPLPEQVRTFDGLYGPITPPPLEAGIVAEGESAYSGWTLSLVLLQWLPATPAAALTLLPHLRSARPLIRESAFEALETIKVSHPELFQTLLVAQPNLADSLMSHHAAIAARIPARERVAALKNTSLFAETPENVLSSIVPIMQEVSFAAGHEIFAKGDLGKSLFILYEGEVGIFSGPQRLATFKKGDFFGELALLDAEPRSASAVAQGEVLAFRLDQEDFYDVMEERPEVLRSILRVLCQRLRRQNEKMMVE
jgi:hypothetical protein